MFGSISIRAFHKVVLGARAVGFDLAGLPTIERLGIDSRDCFEERLCLNDLYSLWEEAMGRVGDVGFPFIVAEQYELADYRELALLALTATTLGEALEIVDSDYFRIWLDGPKLLAQKADSAWHVRYDTADASRPGARSVTESGLAQLYRAMCLATEQTIALEQVRFRHRPPPCTRAHERFFRAPVYFDCEHSELVVPSAAFELPIEHAMSPIRTYLAEHADGMMARMPSRVADRVARYLRNVLPEGKLSQAQAASRLGMSERSLRTHLAREGSSFRTLVDEVRCAVAREELRKPNACVSEIACNLGFSEPSAFHRAFKRWTGLTPRDYRARLH